MMPVTGSNMKRQVNPMAMGEMNTGMTISVRNNPMPRIRVSSRSAKKNPSAIWTETTTTHQTRVSRMLFQKTSLPSRVS